MRPASEGLLPLSDLEPAVFERFCFALLSAEGHAEIRLWGKAGNEQGCDLISVDPEGRCVVTQCKRKQRGAVGPKEAEKELRKLLQTPPSPPPQVWALAATCALSRETEEHIQAILDEDTTLPGLKAKFYGDTALDTRARKHPELVELFFGAGYRNDPPLWWVSAAPVDREWAEAFAVDLRTCLQLCNPKADVVVGVPSEDEPWPKIPPEARWGLVLVSPEALADSSLLQLWRDTLCQPCQHGGSRKLLAVDFAPTPWPAWLSERFERVLRPSAQQEADDSEAVDESDVYRLDLSAIICKYIGLTEHSLPAAFEGPGSQFQRLPAPLRQQLVEWLMPAMADSQHRWVLSAALGLGDMDALEKFELPELQAAAAITLHTGDDDPGAGALRILDILRTRLKEGEDRLRRLSDIEQALRALQQEPSSDTRADLLGAWLHHVESSHQRLVHTFQQDQELDLLNRVFVELELMPGQQPLLGAARLHAAQLGRKRPEDGGRSGAEPFGHPRGQALDDLLNLDPAEHEWVTRRWIVRGDPGSGKTTLLRHLAARLAKEPSRGWVPLFQSLPVLLRDGKDLLERAEEVLQREGLVRVLDHAGDEGRLLVLLDGLDEVSPEARPRAEQQIRRLAERWPKSPIVVTTRPIGYRRFAGDFREVQLQPLDRARRVDFLARWFGRAEGTHETARAETALNELDGPGFEELTGNPLYLTLMALLLEEGISPAHSRARLYDQVFQLLLEGKHKLDLRSGGFQSIDRPGLVRKALRLLAESMTLDNLDAESFVDLQERMYRESLEPVRIELPKVRRWDGNLPKFLLDISEKVGILGPHDGPDADWRFWHRTFKEALTAERMAQWPAEQLLEHATKVKGQESRWAEPFALICGGVKDADALLKQLLEANRDLALRALPTAQNVSDETVREVLELTDDWRKRSEVYEKLPELIGDGERCLRLIDRLRNDVRGGNDLYFLDHAAWKVGEASEDFRTQAEVLRRRIYDELPKVEEPELLRRWRRPDGGALDLWCRIPAGIGWVGSTEEELEDDDDRKWETPRHRVEVTADCWLSAVPVTNELYAAFDPTKEFYPWQDVGTGELTAHPRVSVTWYEAVSFCRWLALQPGFENSGPSLPEEEVWEFACRAGTETRYWMGEDEAQLAEVGWYEENSKGRTHRVGKLPENPFGLHDVHGNVWEWMATEGIEERYKGRDSETPYIVDPAAPAADLAASPRVGRVVRGGCYGSAALWCRSAYRSAGDPWSVFQGQGFRVLLSSAPSGL